MKIVSKEGQSVEMAEDVATTSKYLQTVLKEDPQCESIQTNIPYESLVIAKQFCIFVLLLLMCSRIPHG